MRSTRNLVLALAVGATATGTAVVRQPPTPEFDWATITPSHDLEYHDCYDDFKCARLKVPLDWKNESDSRTISIAITKLPAVVPQDDPTFRGSIFTNPGGPGGSGVAFILRHGLRMQKELVDIPGHQHYEIVSFDPRGIGHTQPLSDCFRSSHFARTAWNIELRALGPLNSGDRAVGYGLALSDSFSRHCKETEENWGEEVMQYVNTPSVARDMVEMVDKIDELRKREISEKQGDNARSELKKRASSASDNQKPRLQYIGFSYGTILGNYFASMFPERVGRLILDGVSNADDYSTGPGWLTNLVDTDEIFANFWTGCFNASSSAACPFIKTDKTAAAAQRRFWKWLKELDVIPLPVAAPDGGLLVLTGHDVRGIIFTTLYSPLGGFKKLAVMLHEAMSGNATEIVQNIGQTLPTLEDTCPLANKTSRVVENPESGSAVLCSDGDDITGHGASWWSDYASKQVSLSKIGGPYWANIRFTCSRWPFKANWSFKGPFQTPDANPTIPGRPEAPILFLTNSLDPVTPLSAARAMSKQHPGSAVVVQNAMGHCSISGGPSQCIVRIVKNYFDNGTVPARETLCEADCGPWDDGCVSLYGLDEFVPRLRKFPLGLY